MASGEVLFGALNPRSRYKEQLHGGRMQSCPASSPVHPRAGIHPKCHASELRRRSLRSFSQCRSVFFSPTQGTGGKHLNEEHGGHELTDSIPGVTRVPVAPERTRLQLAPVKVPFLLGFKYRQKGTPAEESLPRGRKCFRTTGRTKVQHHSATVKTCDVDWSGVRPATRARCAS